MTLEQFIRALKNSNQLQFRLPNGELVPEHFHITEVGKSKKEFIDCGGNYRSNESVTIQLWIDDQDKDHRLSSKKLMQIINKVIVQLSIDQSLPVEVEYQGQTVELYGLSGQEGRFQLVATQTDCLAKEACGVPTRTEKPKRSLRSLQQAEACEPNSGCC